MSISVAGTSAVVHQPDNSLTVSVRSPSAREPNDGSNLRDELEPSEMPASNRAVLQAAVLFLAAGSALGAILGVLPAEPPAVPNPGQGPAVEVEQQQTVEPD